MQRMLTSGLIMASLYLSGCVDVPEHIISDNTLPETNISGIVTITPVSNTTVRVFSYDNGTKGEVLAESTTLDDGSFSLTLSARSQPLLIQTTGGAYTDQSNSVTMDLDPYSLRSVVYLDAGSDMTLAITPFTNIAAGLADYQARTDKLSQGHITASAQQLSSIYSFDIHTTLPCNFADASCEPTAASENERYALALTAFIKLANDICVAENCDETNRQHYSAAVLSELMYRDIEADGLLDGIGLDSQRIVPVQIQLGDTEFNPDLYRGEFARALLKSAWSLQNLTAPQDWDDMIALARAINSSESPLFDDTPVASLDDSGPSITYAFDPDEQVKGIASLPIDIFDDTAVDQINFEVNGIRYAAVDPEAPVLQFNSEDFGDGETTVRLSATDILGNLTERTFTVSIVNNAPILSLTSSDIVNMSQYRLELSIDENDIAIDSVSVNDLLVEYIADSPVVSNLSLAPGYNTITVNVNAQNGAHYDYDFEIAYDNAAPEITVTSPGSNAPAVYTRDGELELWQPKSAPDQIMIISEATKALQGLPERVEELTSAHLAFIEFTAEDPVSNAISTPLDELEITVSYFKNGRATFLDRPVNHTDGYVIFALADENLTDEWADHPVAMDQRLEFTVTDASGNRKDYRVDYLAALKRIDTSNSLVAERFYNDLIEVSLLGDLSETTRAELVIGSQRATVSDTQQTNKLQLDTTALNDGRYESVVSIEGLFNNIDSETTLINIDNSAPVISNLNYSQYVNDDYATVTGTVVDAGIGLKTITLNGLPVQYTAATGAFSVVGALGTSDQTYNLSIEASDQFDQSASTTISIVRDTFSPSVSITSGDSQTWTNTTSRTIRGTCSDAGSGVADVSLTVNGNSVGSDCSDGTFSARFTGISDGQHDINISATDNAGNRKATSRSNGIRIDTFAPDGAFDSINSAWTKSTSATISGQCSDDASGAASVAVKVGSTTRTTNCVNGGFSRSFTGLPTGTLNVSATVTDVAGNTKLLSSAKSLRIDNRNPVVADIQRGFNGCFASSVGCSVSHTFEINASDTESGIDSVSANQCAMNSSGTELTCSMSWGRYCGGADNTVTLEPVVTARDNVGNTASKTGTVIFNCLSELER